MHKIAKLAQAAAIAAAVLTGGFAHAQFQKTDDAIKYRKSAFFLMQQNFARVAAMAEGKVPFDAKAAAEYAELAALMGKQPWQAFGPGTEGGRAKAEIWTQNAKFKQQADDMQVNLGKLAAASKTGNLDAIKAAVKATGGSCKSCHDDFRNKE